MTYEIKVIQHVGYDRFTIDHLPLCQRLTLATKIYWFQL
jgi:hypothetical protein